MITEMWSVQLGIGKEVHFVLYINHSAPPNAVNSSSVCFIFAVTHLQCNCGFAPKYEYHLVSASRFLFFIVGRLVGGRLVIINKVAQLTLEIAASTYAVSEICSSWNH